MPPRGLGRIVNALGYRLERLDDAAWVLRRKGGATPLHVRALHRGTWLVERRRNRQLVRALGPEEAASHLVTDRAASRQHIGAVQRDAASYLAEEMRAWLLRTLEVNCVLDVGANVGQFARRLRSGGYTGRIVSFEPVAGVAEQLRARAAEDPDWLVHQCALGETAGSAWINVTPGTLSSLRDPSEFGREWSNKLRTVTREEIEVRRLADVLDEATAGIADPRVFLKLDTQGFDLQAFRGAGERRDEILAVQSEVACLSLYEQMPRLPEAVTEYEAAGFEIVGLYPVSRDRATGRVIEFDALLVRPSAF